MTMEMWLLESEAAIRSPNQRDAFVDVLHTWILAAGPASPLVASLTHETIGRQQTPFQTPSGTILPRMRFDELADVIREHGPSLAVEVTTAFLDRHPDWRERYGSRAMSAGIQDAGYHVAFLAAAVEADDPSAFADYARWTARVLAARGIESRFLAENLAQVQGALAARLGVDRGNVLARHFQAALEALALEPALSTEPVLDLTAQVFLQAITTGQRHAAVQIAKEALRSGLSLRELYVDVFQPALTKWAVAGNRPSDGCTRAHRDGNYSVRHGPDLRGARRPHISGRGPDCPHRR